MSSSSRWLFLFLALGACQAGSSDLDPSNPTPAELDDPSRFVEDGMYGGTIRRESSDGKIEPVAGAKLSLFATLGKETFLSDDALSRDDGGYILRTPIRGHGALKVSVDGVSYDLLAEITFDCSVHKHDWLLKRAAAGAGFDVVETATK